jgi:pimeloyl-ACP methyl ester carboxylesterase
MTQTTGRVTSTRRWRHWIITAAAGVTFALSYAYLAANRETVPVESVRAARVLAAGEGFIPLSAGITHYRWDGPGHGSVVVLVHGYMDTMADWDAVVPGLTSAGFRVLRFDMYGTGLTARPQTPYTRELLRGQLLDVLDRLHVARADVVGHSLGGAIAVDFAARHPERVGHLALLAPAVHVTLPELRILRVPLVGHYLARTYFLPDVAKRLGVRASKGQAWAGAAVGHMQYNGTEAGFLSIIAGDGFSDYRPECQRVGTSSLPVLLMWGSRDVLVDRGAMDDARAAMPRAEWHELAGEPHELPMDSAVAVTPVLLRFLGEPVER